MQIFIYKYVQYLNAFPPPYDFLNIFFFLAYFKNAVYLYLSFGGDKNYTQFSIVQGVTPNLHVV